MIKLAQYLTHVISYGETLHSIAQNLLGNSERWIEIAELNGLEFPFISEEDTGNPKVKTIGDTLIIPIDEDLKRISELAGVEEVYDEVFGKDISLFSNEFISLEGGEGALGSNEYGDLKTVTGLSNLRQALIIKFSTPIGSLLYHPNFGTKLYEITGKKLTFETVHLIKLEAERTARSDERVEDVKVNVTTVENRDGEGFDMVLVDLEVYAVGIDRAIQLSFGIKEGGVLEWV